MKVAILCNYELRPDRIGGMDHFFWMFDETAKQSAHTVHWYFPNSASHGKYPSLTIYASNQTTVESFFLESNIKYDIVYTHFLELCTPFFKTIKTNNPNCKVFAVDHNPRPVGGYAFKKRIEKRVKGWLYSKYIDIFIGVSLYTKHELLQDFGSGIKSKLQIIYNGIITDEIKRRERRKSSAPSFLTACHLRHSKGIQDLIEAVHLLPDPIRQQIHIDIFGDGDYKSTLVGMIEDRNLQQQFTFRGNSPDLGNIYQRYDYLLHPSHMECFSLGLLESLAANVPVITTTVGGNTEVVTDNINGYLFSPGNIIQLSETIKQLFTGQKSISGQTDSLIKNEFTLEKMVNSYLRLLS